MGVAKGADNGRSGAARPVPMATLERLSTYLNCLMQWERDGVGTVSSATLQGQTGVSAQQVRKDLSYFGEFGRRGKGYPVRELREALAGILELRREQVLVLVGVGSLGTALLAFPEWKAYNFRIGAVFDIAPNKVGRRVRGHDVLPLDALPDAVRQVGARIGMVSVPPQAAQDATDALVRAGIRLILNFAPVSVQAPPGHVVRNVCFVSELAVLSYLAQSPACRKAEPKGPPAR